MRCIYYLQGSHVLADELCWENLFLNIAGNKQLPVHLIVGQVGKTDVAGGEVPEDPRLAREGDDLCQGYPRELSLAP